MVYHVSIFKFDGPSMDSTLSTEFVLHVVIATANLPFLPSSAAVAASHHFAGSNLHILVSSTLLSQLNPNDVSSCTVCKDKIEVNSEAKQLLCKHLYHSDYITPWLELHNLCLFYQFQLTAATTKEEEKPDVDNHGNSLTFSEISR